MSVLDHNEYNNHEHVAFFNDKYSGLQAIIAVHNTNLGPALGGCRMWSYANSEEALTDVLRLSKGMTYKAAMANVALGGGKSVILGDPRAAKTPAMMEAMGKFVDTFKGRYYTAEDSGISVEDLQHMEKHSNYIAGIHSKYHISEEKSDGNPSPATALGVFVGVKAAVAYQYNTDLRGVKVAIQGLGSVGIRLARHLKNAGAELFVADVYKPNVTVAAEELGAVIVDPQDILTLDVDVIAPCALGATINPTSLPNIKAKVIAGAANNQLANEGIGTECRNRGILYAPDYVINAGGIIDIYHQKIESSDRGLKSHIENIGQTLTDIFKGSDEQDLATNIVANKIAEERFLKK
ncbi:Glu/Leu/Phe/Val dehydrogenase [Alteromonas sp. 5E99-2]|uniref:Leu/Phe/Val dehydrogenase n=1 Tax=Alteromonas sp. 5E99-2 TaxID=2817683 RepID=UPI001A97D8AF|nr:Glu/Leu/Phe/Val dehydrogenase [Alteromonas sp. 5E99-2]MBO1255179.1 Glu/Leu/Phe/Val dehydrogenase [Alteromonas sp. 5E99-2]